MEEAKGEGIGGRVEENNNNNKGGGGRRRGRGRAGRGECAVGKVMCSCGVKLSENSFTLFSKIGRDVRLTVDYEVSVRGLLRLSI